MHETAARLGRRLRDGAPPVLPVALDRAAEWWARRPPRDRITLAATAAGLVVLRGIVGDGAASVTVLVAARDLAAGTTITAADLERQPRPSALVPSGAVDADEAVAGRLSGPLPAGAVLASAHLAPAHPTDLTPHGQVALAIPAEELPPLAVGTIVDLHGGNGGGVHGGVVLGDLDGMTWIAVPRSVAATLVEALAWGPVRVAVVAATPPGTTPTPGGGP